MAEAAQKDSSMEDILASIRKIITSDESNKSNEETGVVSSKSVPEPQVASKAPAVEIDAAPEPAAASTAPASVQAGSLAALSAQLKAQTPSKPSTPISTASLGVPERKEELVVSSENPVPTRSPAVPDLPKPETSAGSLAALAAQVQTDRPSAPIAPKPKVEPEPAKLRSDVKSPYSGESLRDLASRVAASPSQKPDAPAATNVVTEVKPEVSEPVVEAPKAPEPVSEKPQQAAPDEQKAFKEALVAPATKSAVTGSMDRLRKAADDVDSAQVESILRPMLKEWLDANLPSMVEKLVQEEISRISNGK